MSTSFPGLYRLDSGGKPAYVQVAVLGRHSIPLAIDLHESRGDLPNWREVPTENHYKRLLANYRIAQGASAFINQAETDECADGKYLASAGKITGG